MGISIGFPKGESLGGWVPEGQSPTPGNEMKEKRIKDNSTKELAAIQDLQA